ncbi:hypothetical protein BH11PSE2_BH11PSE2_08080 [soil metagenome]
MRLALSVAALLLASAAPAAAQDYFDTMASAKHGHGYSPATIVAGSELTNSFTVVAITNGGIRTTNVGPAQDWRVVVTIGPHRAADADDEEDERYLDKRATAPTKPAGPTGALVARSERQYSSQTCPAIAARIEALRPLAVFEFNPPFLTGNTDGPNGDGRQGFDLWMRLGAVEVSRSADSKDSKLAAWMKDTLAALEKCPASKAPG